MKTLEIPFNRHLEIEKADSNTDYIFCLKANKRLVNHLEAMHASALFSVAEATSGEFLINEFEELINEVIPVVRKAEVKFSKPVFDSVYSKAGYFQTNKIEVLNGLHKNKRTIIRVKVDLYNEKQEKVFTSVFDWFIIKKEQDSTYNTVKNTEK